MKFNPTLKLMDTQVAQLATAPGAVVEKIKTKDLIKTIETDLAVPKLFQALDDMTPEKQKKRFNKILDKDKEGLQERNEDFNKNLALLAKGTPYSEFVTKNEEGKEIDYFAKIRTKFLHMLSQARFFSNISPADYKELEEYTRTLGKLKDKKVWEEGGEINYRELITNNEKIMGIISRLEAGDATNLKTQYQKVVTEVQELLEKKGKDFKKTQFHDVRKNLRFAAYLIETLNKKFEIPECEEIYEKYMNISNRLAHVREVTGKGDMSWKDAVKDVLAGINNKSDLEGKSGPSRDKHAEVAEIATANEFSES